MRTVDEKYVNGANSTSTEEIANNQERVWGAISGMVESLGDPYTVFLPPEDKKSFEEDVNGSFGGVGIEIGVRDSILTVISALPNTPAKFAGVQSGDIILEVDGTPTVNMNVEEAVRLIRGEVGTAVVLTIGREGEDIQKITVTRGVINIPTIDTELKDEGVFVISLYNFSSNSRDAFRGALKEFIDAKTDKLVVDLRGNPGGFLSAAIDISSWFLPSGKVVVREVKGGGNEDAVYRSSGYNIFNEQLKMVILVDEGSASASEIVAGALSEHGIATLIGQQTFGKGSVQELVSITKETSLKVTVAKWLTPNGLSISAEGLTPDIAVDRTREDALDDRDAQMDAAIDFLINS